MRAILLVILATACSHRPSRGEAAAEIDRLADRACACADESCASKALDEIGELADIVDVTKVDPTSAQAMAGWTRAISCEAGLATRPPH